MDVFKVVAECVWIAAAWVCIGRGFKKDKEKETSLLGMAFCLMFVLGVGFAVAQLAHHFGFIASSLTYNPLDILSFMAGTYYVSMLISVFMKKKTTP